MLLRALVLLTLVLLIPSHSLAAYYKVKPGDSLSLIAQRYHVSLHTLARVNGLANLNLVQIGRLLVIPGTGARTRAGTRYYRVKWGDSLSVIAVRFHTTIARLRGLNPRLGPYLLAGQLLRVPGYSSRSYRGTSAVRSVSYGTRYVVRPGDTLSGIAVSYGVSLASLMSANGIANPDHVVIGATLAIPGTASYAVYDPYTARALIVQYAAFYGLEPSFPLAVGWLESGFNQTVVSYTGAIGVMQVEPYTADHISRLLGRQLNVHQVDDNIRAGVFWLATLVRYYGGNEALAAAAYYQGTKALARHGMYTDTKQYVANVMALKTRFGG